MSLSKNGFDRKFMRRAIELARAAGERGEVPVGAVIVKEGKIIAEGSNSREENRDVIGHAEINAISKACSVLGDWRLNGCTIYVTLEPCPMCAGAIINARIDTVVFGAFDLRNGCFESVTDFSKLPFDIRPEIYGGICEAECEVIISEFFRRRVRRENREEEEKGEGKECRGEKAQDIVRGEMR